MLKRMAGGLKRAAALMMSIFIILSQLALPVAALAQDVTMLPGLNLYYSVNGEPQTVFVLPALYANQPVYWAMVAPEALQSVSAFLRALFAALIKSSSFTASLSLTVKDISS